MAFWNAPLDDLNHAKNAVAAAQEMRRKLIDAQRGGRREGPARDRDLPADPIGIGINTGEVCVGNFGSHQNSTIRCSVIRSTVASRLESLTKTYGVELIIGEETAARLDMPA